MKTLTIPSCLKVLAAMAGAIVGQPLAAQEKISLYLFGQNHWLADGDEGRVGYLEQLWPKVRESGVKIVRIGGNGYESKFPSREKLDAMIDRIRGIDAEPLLQVPRTFSAEQARELVIQYTTGERRVKFWSIGNEPMLHDRNTLEEVHAYLVKLGPAMREAGPEIRIFMFDEASLKMPAHAAIVGGELDVTGMKTNGRWVFDGVAFHSYPLGADFSRDDVIFAGPKRILDQITTLQGLIAKANGKHGRQGDEALLWGLTEMNVTYRNPDRDIAGRGNASFLGGQFTAEIFGQGMQHGAHMVIPWCINETDRVETDFGYIGLPPDFAPRSSFYHMQMMSRHMKGSFIASSDNQDYVKTIAAGDDGSLAVMVMNQHDEDGFDFEIRFGKSGTASKLPLLIEVEAGTDAPFEGRIEPQTSMLHVFDRSGGLKKTVIYDLKANLENRPPTEKR